MKGVSLSNNPILLNCINMYGKIHHNKMINNGAKGANNAWLSVTCLSGYTCLTTDPEIESSIPARSHIGHWLDMVYLPPRGNFVDHIFS